MTDDPDPFDVPRWAEPIFADILEFELRKLTIRGASLRGIRQLREGDTVFDEGDEHLYAIDEIDDEHITLRRVADDRVDRWPRCVIQAAIDDGDWTFEGHAPLRRKHPAT